MPLLHPQGPTRETTLANRRRGARPALLSCALLAAFAVAAQACAVDRAQCEDRYRPQTGQAGKDVVWVPTSDALVNRMLKMAAVTPQDLVYDLGAGDGKIAIAAARDFGARAVGVEYNPVLARLGQCLAEADGVADRVRIQQGDIFETDFSDATVVTLYLLPNLNLRLRPTLLQMKPGTRVVSHSFLMDDWEPDERSMTEDGNAYLWIVPASVAGDWSFRPRNGDGRIFSVRLEQKFQEISGVAGERGRTLTEAQLEGDRVRLVFAESGSPTRVDGRLTGERIEARVTRDGQTLDYLGERSER
ncbi:MAG: class I SAM-dependent methyltransferase [Steroidobacteraceae bacterium]|nr:class I SAM-dependent methyltransferase [Steroidobacteraceae bacterium]